MQGDTCTSLAMTSCNFSRDASPLSFPAFLREGEMCYFAHKVLGLQRFHMLWRPQNETTAAEVHDAGTES